MGEMSEERNNGVRRFYRESEDRGNHHRMQQYTELTAWITRLQDQSGTRRQTYFTPDYTDCQTYSSSIAHYRKEFAAMVGLPRLTSSHEETAIEPLEEAAYELIGEDELGEIYRVTIPVREGLHAYGLLMRPTGKGPFPLVISQHGGQGIPEMTAGFFDSANYNDMSRRIVQRGVAVFAPQLLLWETGRFGPVFDRKQIDVQLKQLGSSITALELFKIQRSLDHLLERPDIDAKRVGMVGLSYGGFYTLFATALDPRIGVAVSSCFVNDRFTHGRSDWTWHNSGNMFLDAEVCGLICPRPLYIEGGSRDELFGIQGFVEESRRGRVHYDRLVIGDRFKAVVFDGAHEFNPQDEPINFLMKYL